MYTAPDYPQGVCHIRKAAELPTAVQSAGCAALQDRDCQCAGSRGKAPRPFSWGCKGDILFREREYPPLSRPHTVWGTTMQRCRAALRSPLRRRAQKKAAFRLPIFSVHRAHEGRRSLLKSHVQLHAVRAHIARGVFIGMPVLGRGAALMEKRRRAGRAGSPPSHRW